MHSLQKEVSVKKYVHVIQRNHLQNLGTDWRIILKLMLKKYDTMIWTELIWIRIGRTGGLL
jgi:hypothetical protein